MEYAIYFATGDRFVQPDGSLGEDPAWKTMADWGTVTCTGLVYESNYHFAVLAKNDVGDVSPLSEITVGRTNSDGYEPPASADETWSLLE